MIMKRGKVRKSMKSFKISDIKDFFNNKKVLHIAISVFIVLAIAVLFVNVSGATITGHITLLDGISEVVTSVGDILKPVAEFLFGDLGKNITGELLFAKVLFFVIVLGIVWMSLKKVDLFDEHPPILIIIALAVSILAVRGIATEELIKTILLPYSVLGVALTAGIPFVIYFIIVNIGLKDQPKIVRRIAWIFFAVIFIGLWISKGGELGNFQYIYLIAIIAAVIMAWIDGTIQKFFLKVQESKLKNLSKERKIAYLKKELADMEEMVLKGSVDKSEVKNVIKDLEKKLKYFRKKK